jgi:uncharacterized caspase-like protein
MTALLRDGRQAQAATGRAGRRRRRWPILLTGWCLIAIAADAAAAQRVALVIGNGAYGGAGALAEAPASARKVGAALTQLGFATEVAADLDLRGLQLAVRDFGIKAAGAETAVLYFAGHGLQVGGANYLLPIDARLRRERDLLYAALPLEVALGEAGQARRLGLVILDAAHANPMAEELRRGLGPKGAEVGAGLAPAVDLPANSLVAFAAGFGEIVPADAPAGAYADALAQHLAEPGLEVGVLFRKVRAAVQAATGGRQTPQIQEALGAEPAYLQPPATAAAPAGNIESDGAERGALDAQARGVEAERLELARLREALTQARRKQVAEQTRLAAAAEALEADRAALAARERDLAKLAAAAEPGRTDRTRSLAGGGQPLAPPSGRDPLRAARAELDQAIRDIAALRTGEAARLQRLAAAERDQTAQVEALAAERAALADGRAKLDRDRAALEQERTTLEAVLTELAALPDPDELQRLRRELDARAAELARREAALAARSPEAAGGLPTRGLPAARQSAEGWAVVQAPANLRAGPGMSHPVVGGLAKGDRILVRERAAGSDWYRVERADGLAAYLHRALIGAPPPAR